MTKNSLVLYRSFLALVQDRDSDKFLIKFCTQPATSTGKKAIYSEQKVREKDIVLLHEGPVSSLENALAFSDEKISTQLEETWELLQSDESTASEKISLSDLADYARGSFKPEEAWAFYSALTASSLFALSQEDLKNGQLFFFPRSQKEIEAINQKKYEIIGHGAFGYVYKIEYNLLKKLNMLKLKFQKLKMEILKLLVYHLYL